MVRLAGFVRTLTPQKKLEYSEHFMKPYSPTDTVLEKRLNKYIEIANTQKRIEQARKEFNELEERLTKHIKDLEDGESKEMNQIAKDLDLSNEIDEIVVSIVDYINEDFTAKEEGREIIKVTISLTEIEKRSDEEVYCSICSKHHDHRTDCKYFGYNFDRAYRCGYSRGKKLGCYVCGKQWGHGN